MKRHSSDETPHAEFRLTDGRALPSHLKALRSVARRGGSVTRRALLRATQGTLDRLPAMRVRYEDGRVFELPAGDPMYGPIIITGEWEPSESRVIASLLEPGDFALDIGANHGWYTLLMAEVVGAEGTILAFEPCPPLGDALVHNLELNGNPAQIGIQRIALGAEKGELTINVFRGLPHGHASTSTLGRDDYESFTVPAETLDSVVPERAPALIKIDVEGAEQLVFEGAASTLSSSPMVLLEVNYETSSAFGYSPSDLLRTLAGYGISTVFRVEEGGLRREVDPDGAPHGTAWLAVPDDRLERVREVS